MESTGGGGNQTEPLDKTKVTEAWEALLCILKCFSGLSCSLLPYMELQIKDKVYMNSK